jgi:uncharacterized membrane protein YtjA (UPF0391 family)
MQSGTFTFVVIGLISGILGFGMLAGTAVLLAKAIGLLFAAGTAWSALEMWRTRRG